MRTWALWGRARMVTVILGALLLVSSDAKVRWLRMLITLRPLFFGTQIDFALIPVVNTYYFKGVSGAHVYRSKMQQPSLPLPYP